MSNQQPPTGDPEYRPAADNGGLPQFSGNRGMPEAGKRVVPPQPTTVRTAVILMLVGAAISLIALIVGLATTGGLRDQIQQQLQATGQSMTPSALDAAVGVSITSLIVSQIIAILLWLWMAWKNGQGRKWARIVGTILGGINIASTISVLAVGSQTGATMTVTLINAALAIVIIILLWVRPSSEFFNAASARPVGY